MLCLYFVIRIMTHILLCENRIIIVIPPVEKLSFWLPFLDRMIISLTLHSKRGTWRESWLQQFYNNDNDINVRLERIHLRVEQFPKYFVRFLCSGGNTAVIRTKLYTYLHWFSILSTLPAHKKKITKTRPDKENKRLQAIIEWAIAIPYNKLRISHFI